MNFSTTSQLKETTELRQLKQALIDADAVARERGDRFGLCDSLDNKGNPYPSQWLDDILTAIKAQGILPMVRLTNPEHKTE